jgi:asparagine synthase (glutamine-hydrolysing)
VPRLLGVWHPRAPGDRWVSAVSAAAGSTALADGALTVAGARRCGGVVAGIDGELFRVGTRERPGDPVAALAAEWLAGGDRVLGGLRGEAAFVLWDGGRRRGILARDQLGIGCLYLRDVGDAIAFASDIAGLLELTGPAEPDEDGVACWLALAQWPPGGTPFAGITRIGAGEALVLDDGRSSRWRYWSPDPGHPASLRGDEAAAAVRDAIAVAVGRRVPPDGAAATLLSGGLDSTAVAATAARGSSPGTLRAYSALFPGFPAQDESAWIGPTVEALGLEAGALEVHGGSIVAGAADWAARRRLPLPAPNWFYQRSLLERMAADGVTVALDGEGGDEVFGADRFLVSDALRRGRPLRAVRLARRLPSSAAGAPSPRALVRFLARYGVRGALSAGVHDRLRRSGASAHGPAWLAPWAARRAAARVDPWRWKQPGQPRWWSHLVFGLTETVDAIGARDYFRAKGALTGIRVAHPLFDVDLVELVLSLDPEAAYGPGPNRPLLRRSMRGWAPEPVLRRTGKSRFEPLFMACFAGADAPIVTELLGDPAARIRRWTEPHHLEAMFALGPSMHPGGPHRWADDGFRLVATEIWLRSLEDPSFPETLLASPQLAPLSARFRS